MPFIGKNPTSGFSTIVKDDLTPDGSTTAFTLSKNVASANDIAVFVGNVRQEPTDAYSVSGTTLTMTAAPASGINFYVLHIAGTLESSVVPAAGTTVPGNFGVSGRLGVGISDPSQDIDLVGTGNSGSGSVKAGGTSSGTQAAFIAQAQFGSASFGTYSNYPAILNSSNSPMVYFDTNNSNRGIFAGGIAFNGDTAAANALDDYEEGTFTPTATPGSGSYTTTELDGRYTKVGRLVAFQIYFKITTVGSASSGVTISGLPFTSLSWYRMPNKWRENQATGLCGQFTMNSGQASGFMQNDDGTNITQASGRTFLINGLYYSA